MKGLALALIAAAALLLTSPVGFAGGRAADGGVGVGSAFPASDQTSQTSGAAATEWRTFEGSWSASGTRTTLPTEGDGVAAVVHLSGAVVLTTSAGTGIGHGFRGESIGFHDGQALSTGRVMWTDRRGDRIFGRYKGGPLRPGDQVTIVLTGGTGRYAGIAGEVALTWQFVVNAEDGVVQVRSTSLKGRYRLAEVAR